MDIDDLLDEVESKYVKKSAPSASSVRTISKPKENKRSGLDADIDDLLDLDIPDSRKSDNVSKSNTTVTSYGGAKSGQKSRCFPVFVGGSDSPMGRGSSVNQLCCDQLRCTDCDFRICWFDNFSWCRDTDYLFLRNNAPDFQKLKGKLSKKKGSRAYCCQCQWRNVTSLEELRDPQLKWVCGKHSS